MNARMFLLGTALVVLGVAGFVFDWVASWDLAISLTPGWHVNVFPWNPFIAGALVLTGAVCMAAALAGEASRG